MNHSDNDEKESGPVNYVRLLLSCLTIGNCFGYAFLYRLTRKQYFLRLLTKHPFISSFDTVVAGIGYSFIGDFITKMCGVYSNIVFNGYLGYVNYRMLKAIKNNC